MLFCFCAYSARVVGCGPPYCGALDPHGETACWQQRSRAPQLCPQAGSDQLVCNARLQRLACTQADVANCVGGACSRVAAVARFKATCGCSTCSLLWFPWRRACVDRCALPRLAFDIMRSQTQGQDAADPLRDGASAHGVGLGRRPQQAPGFLHMVCPVFVWCCLFIVAVAKLAGAK